MTNTIIEDGASANIRARQLVHVEEEFHADAGSEVHLFTDHTFLDCNTEVVGMVLSPDPPSEVVQGVAKCLNGTKLELRFAPKSAVVSVLPNPCTDQLIIEGDAVLGSVRVLDEQGRVVHQGTTNSSRLLINTSTWATGNYSVLVGNSQPANVSQIIKVR